MKLTPKLKRGLYVFLSVLILILTLVSCNALSEINKTLGGHIAVVDQSKFSTTTGNLAITNVNVLSQDSKTMLSNKTVLISNKIIQEIGDSIAIPANYTQIDGTGKYLIPGLIDSHVHLKRSKNDLLLYLANGVTQVGEMTGMKEHFKYREEIKQGKLGPGIYIASPKVSSQKGLRATFRSMFERREQNYTTPKKARKAVAKYKKKGYQAIKLSSSLSRESYFAVTQEAKAQNIPVIGHLPGYVYMEDLYTSGQSQLAHIPSILQAERNQYGGVNATNAAEFLTYFEAKADTIAKKLKENNISASSTLWVYESMDEQDFELGEFLKTIQLEYQNPGWVEGTKFSGGWLPGTGNGYEYPDNTSPEAIAKSKIYWEMQSNALRAITRAMINNGVTITAGTDAHGANGVVPGFSLHDELATLADFGLSNSQVLQAATAVPAKWMGVETGSIQIGYKADLVLLDQNPLINIKNTTAINAVIANGTYLNRETLNAMLAAVKEANNKGRRVNIDAFID